MTPKQKAKLLARYRVEDGDTFRLKHFDPADTAGDTVSHEEAKELLTQGVTRLAELQETLYAQHRWALLCVLQAMDAGGKDGTIKHVMSGVNPQGVRVVSFKAPGPHELDRDFLWRVHDNVPARGEIGIFNRSHYEEVLAVRVHPEFLARQNLPDAVQGKKFWKHRLEDIACFERYLSRQGIAIVKFFLHVSPEEQRKRLAARLEDPSKHWKFNANDLAEREHWDAYADAYQDAIAATASPHAPWFVVPADHKWFAHLVVVEAMTAALESLDLAMPKPDAAQTEAIEAAKRALEGTG